MAQKFFENTLVSQFIKNIVANASVPVISTVNYYDYIIEGNFYVLVDKIIKCTKSGLIESNDASKRASYTDIQHFEFGRQYPQLTETYFSNEGYYDPETHRHLGKFLRCLRDTKYIDLMPFYNCFNYKTTKGSLVHNEETGEITYSPESTDQYKLFIVPIALNKTYTIYMDAGTNITMLPVLYTEDRELKGEDGPILSETHYKIPYIPKITIKDTKTECTNIGDAYYLEDESKNLMVLASLPDTFVNSKDIPSSLGKYFAYVKFTSPETYKLDSSIFDNESVLGNLEKYLHLFIQLPKNCTSSVVILEGDYTDVQSDKVFDCSEKDQVVLNKLLLKNLSLTMFNNQTIYAFSDRLVEFLLLAVVNSLDDISNNILRVQQLAGMSKANGFIPHIWTPVMRRKFFETYLSKSYVDGTFKVDVTGFVDSKIEKMLLQGEYTRINQGESQ